MFKNKSKEEKKYLIFTLGVICFTFLFLFLWAINLRQIIFPVVATDQVSQDNKYWQNLRVNVLGDIEEFSNEWNDLQASNQTSQGEAVLNNLKSKIEEKNTCLLGEDCE